jgi:uncharacterized membrane protein
MSFSRDIQHTRYRTARTLVEDFGPNAKLHVERKSEARSWLYAIGSGIAVGAIWWLIVALRVGGGA